MRKRAGFSLIVCMLAWLLAPGLFGRAASQAENGAGLAAAVNTLRASLGLPAYTIDPGLMQYAQAHTDYQAAKDQSTHVHSDGSLSWESGIQENVAAGDGISISTVVYNIWVDEGHRKVMVGYSSGSIGAGVATAADGTVYYTINVRPGTDAVTVTAAPYTPAPFVPLKTHTPQPDGAIYHTVGPGETLWKIALSYGVTVEVIRQLNNLPAGSTVILVGQRLLVRPVQTAAPAPTETAGDAPPAIPSPPVQPSSTPRPTLPQLTAAPSPSSTPSPPPAPAAGKPPDDRRLLLIPGALALLGAGLLIYPLLAQKTKERSSK